MAPLPFTRRFLMPLSSAREQKLRHRFRLRDTDQNGYLTWDDFDATARQLVAGFAVSPESPRGRAVMETYREFWQEFFVPMDTDGDGRVSEQEYLDAFAGGLVDAASFDRIYQPHVDAIVRLADTDGDGVLSQAEFCRLMAVYGVGEDDAVSVFHQADTNGDGQLSTTEFLALARGFFLDDGTDGTGSRLFGSV
jgi:Ca2+-binding EF-hand superfamily protein